MLYNLWCVYAVIDKELIIMKRLHLICLLGTILSIASLPAQDNANIEHTIASAIFNKERTVRVFLPSRYLNDSTATFPVVYVLDAQSCLLYTSDAADE